MRYVTNNRPYEKSPDTRPLDLFDLACAFACVAITAGAVLFAIGVIG